MSRPSTADMTIAASTIALGVAAAIEAAATRNGITADQMAAGMFLQSITLTLLQLLFRFLDSTIKKNFGKDFDDESPMNDVA